MKVQSSTRASKLDVQEKHVSSALGKESESLPFCRAKSVARTNLSELLMCTAAFLLVVLVLSVPGNYILKFRTC